MTKAHRSLALALFVAFVAAGRIAGGEERRKVSLRRPTIAFVGQLPVGNEPIEIEANRKITLRGTVSADGPVDAAIVQVVITRRYDGHVFMSSVARLEAPSDRAQKTLDWVIADVELPLSELGAGYDAHPVVFASNPGLAGVADLNTVRRLETAHGESVRLVVGVADSTQIGGGACRIEIEAIENVYGIYAAATSPDIEVGLSSGVDGTFDAPKGTYLYLSVKPGSSARRWLMPDNISRSGRRYRAVAFTGREGLDYGQEFTLQALLLNRPIQADRPYDADEWAPIESSVCGRSRAVVVRRRVSPGDLRITKIDDALVTSGSTVLDTTSEPGVEGQLVDMRPEHAIRPDETVWLLTRETGTEGWHVTGLAIVHEDRFGWRVPALRLPRPGTYRIMAVAARTKLPLGHTLTPDEWYRLARFHHLRRVSKAVLIRPSRQS